MDDNEIIGQIERTAREDWPDDVRMQRYVIASELAAYDDFRQLDLSALGDDAGQVARIDPEWFTGWETHLREVRQQVADAAALAALKPETMPQEEFDLAKTEAQAEYPADYSGQLRYLQSAIKHAALRLEMERRYAHLKPLIIELEAIIGASAYNGNIQNYGSWGEWESEGRSFRYPLTINGQKTWHLRKDSDALDLLSGEYVFGANRLRVMRALLQIIETLSVKYGFVP